MRKKTSCKDYVVQPETVKIARKSLGKQLWNNNSLVLYTNADTLSNKVEELQSLMSVHKPHVVVVTESLPKNFAHPEAYFQQNHFLQKLQDTYLCQHVQEPTRSRDDSNPPVIDLVITKSPDDVGNIEILPPLGKSDHTVLKLSLKSSGDDSTPQKQTLKYNYTKEAKEIDVITDTSQNCLGAQLKADGTTIAFSSRSLGKTEQRYSQMEKEMLAITFACKRFHRYLFRRKTCVTTDRKPLETIVGKSIQKAPPRLRRLVWTWLVHSVLQTVPITSQRLAQIRLEATKDEVLNYLIQITKVDWPSNKKDLDTGLKSLWNYHQELAELNEFVLKEGRIVIPRCIRAGILDQLHASHLGDQREGQNVCILDGH
ncbi:hypothetical protein QYM36_007210 [Artemia franciscana]|uniref:Reverse transcriptase RNase H-like domain-containing protein n=1 Tax=Artemia franciscana TaxID=6661 RepID=A0AA88HW80_ARTSF|nr:hypothetical protein QYM36_007210 [Artemia franciscana]